jgi:formylglycine-generating enzyme required for sulfatase activity
MRRWNLGKAVNDITDDLDQFAAGSIDETAGAGAFDETQHRKIPSSTPAENTVLRSREHPELGGTSGLTYADVAEGSLLKNRYRLEKRIAAGGMGVVYRAQDLDYQRLAGDEHFLAIKVLRPEFREHPDAVKSLFEEVRKTRELSHPNIVGVFNCEQDGDVVFMTMQYLEGKTLEALLAEDFARGLPWERARPIIEGIGSALAYAHDRGVIHCDLKPSNVFVTLSGVPKVLDFGISRATRGTRGRRFDAGTLNALTPPYSSPEMIRAWKDQEANPTGSNAFSPSEGDDIYALACVAYELLTGRHPFARRDAEEARQSGRVCPTIPNLTRRQNRSIARALAFDPRRRTASVEDFMRELLSPGTPRIKWLVGSITALVVAAVGLLWAAQYRTSHPPSVGQAKGNAAEEHAGSPTVPAAGVLRTLGIDGAKLNAGGTMTAADLASVLRTSPRQVQLGSTTEDIQAALGLCKGLPDCVLDSYADEKTRFAKLAPFSLDPLPVTVAGFRNFVRETHYRTRAEVQGYAYETSGGALKPKKGGNWQNAVDYAVANDDWPVVAVNFDDAVAYCRWRGARLPTEDEWEYAARGPERRSFAWGNDAAQGPANSAVPAPVNAGQPEGIDGRYRDLSGVLWQWVDTNVGDNKILKGGSRLDKNLANRRAAARRQEQPDRADDDTGFRCANSSAEWSDWRYWQEHSS